jgi:hypothetical protein
MERLQRNIFIFDIDQTIVNSEHRQGETLDDWFRLNTAENCMKDTPILPLANYVRDLCESGFQVLICTSRTLQSWDLDYLANRLHVPEKVKIISRPNKGHKDYKMSANTLKKKQLSYLQNFKHFRKCRKFLIDDKEANLRSFEELGSNCTGLNPTGALSLFKYMNKY